jgi:hypothetical protein
MRSVGWHDNHLASLTRCHVPPVMISPRPSREGLGSFCLPLFFGNIKAATDLYQNGFLLLSFLALCCLGITYSQYEGEPRNNAPPILIVAYGT